MQAAASPARPQASAQFALNNPGGLGDQVALSLVAAKDLAYAGLGYSLPLGADGLRARAGYAAMRYRIGEDFEALDARGNSRMLTAGLSYPVGAQRQPQRWLGADASDGRYEDKVLGVTTRDRRVDQPGTGGLG